MMIYPETRRVDTIENHFGIPVADPYRWLETDTRQSPEVASWARAQDDLARHYLSGLPGRAVFRESLSQLFNYSRMTAPERRGSRYFFLRHDGLDDQARLILREGDEDRILIDPNSWSDDGAAALAEWAVSEDGCHVAFTRQEGGTDWRTIQVLDVDTGDVLNDEIHWVRFSTISWTRDGSGFFYSRFPEPSFETAFDGLLFGHSVYFHRLGTEQAQDRLVVASPGDTILIQTCSVTRDGRYAVIYSTPGAGGNALSVVDLDDPQWKPRPIITAFDHYWYPVGNKGATFYLTTDRDAERGKIVSVDLSSRELLFKDLVTEKPNATLNEAILCADRFLISYIVDAKMELFVYRLDGSRERKISLAGIGTVGGFRTPPDDSDVYFVFTGYTSPTTIYHYQMERDELHVWAKPEIATDTGEIIVEQRFFPSVDGTRIPIFVIRRADVKEAAPTILYGYGGFGISMLPYYSPVILAWVKAGGVYAVVNLRGGGEYGKAWHDAGRLANKQNVFDDFISAASYLKADKITAVDGLAIQGESNGGLLVAAVVNQRPDLFAAAMPGVGVMDMLRFQHFTGGEFWKKDYGDPANEVDFKNLLTYSPYHTIRSHGDYPAILITTGDTDERVVPAHSFKYAAALQAVDLGKRPRIVRIDTRAGHGGGKPLRKALDEIADQWAFAAHWTGLRKP